MSSDDDRDLTEFIWWFITGVLIRWVLKLAWWLFRLALLACLYLTIFASAGIRWVLSRVRERAQDDRDPTVVARAPGHYSDDWTEWYSDWSQRWYTCSDEYEHLEICEGSVDPVRKALGSLSGSVFGTEIRLAAFDAIAIAPDGSKSLVEKAQFTKLRLLSVDELQGEEWQSAEDELDRLDQALQACGWLKRDDRGAHWYSNLYYRPVRIWASEDADSDGAAAELAPTPELAIPPVLQTVESKIATPALMNVGAPVEQNHPASISVPSQDLTASIPADATGSVAVEEARPVAHSDPLPPSPEVTTASERRILSADGAHLWDGHAWQPVEP